MAGLFRPLRMGFGLDPWPSRDGIKGTDRALFRLRNFATGAPICSKALVQQAHCASPRLALDEQG